MEHGPIVAVIGGGIIGMSTAWRLAQSGASVTVFEAGRIGNEASWASAGMLAPGGEYERDSLWSELALESLSLYPEFVEELSNETGIEIDFRKCGAFTIARSESEAVELAGIIANQSQIGIQSEQFPPSRVPGLRPNAVAAQYYPDDCVVNPRDVLRALHAACLRARVTLREFTRVDEIPAAPFERVVIAAGAWSGQIRASLGTQIAQLPRSFPIRGHLVAFEEHSGLCDAIVRHGDTYLLRRSGSLILAGASTERVGFDRTLDGRVAAEVAGRAAELIPDLENRSYFAWNGFRPGSESGEPVIGRLANSAIWLAYGHYRNGVLLAPATAKGIAREVMSAELTPANLQTDSLLPAGHPR